jgi:hypothetical protein
MRQIVPEMPAGTNRVGRRGAERAAGEADWGWVADQARMRNRRRRAPGREAADEVFQNDIAALRCAAMAFMQVARA